MRGADALLPQDSRQYSLPHQSPFGVRFLVVRRREYIAICSPIRSQSWRDSLPMTYGLGTPQDVPAKMNRHFDSRIDHAGYDLNELSIDAFVLIR